MQIRRDYDLTKLNTFGISARAKFFTELTREDDIPVLFSSLEFKNNEKLFLGGGSNVLFTRDFDGIVILNKLNGIEILETPRVTLGKDEVLLRAMGGEVWHDFVIFSVRHGYWGIENLALIPGSVGAAPMQNIGAYGAELKDVLEAVDAYDVETGDKRVFSVYECEPGYRDSVFKGLLKGKYFISAITIRLSKSEKKNLGYASLREHIEKNNIEIQTSSDVSNTVSHIRERKLPDPRVVGNAGSFFKNVFVTRDELDRLRAKFPDIRYFEEREEEEGKIKIPAAWLIENSGPLPGTKSALIGASMIGGATPLNGASWKGWRVGHVGVHERHALVLVNYGAGTGEDIKNLAEEIIESVQKKFGITLEPEVNFI